MKTAGFDPFHATKVIFLDCDGTLNTGCEADYAEDERIIPRERENSIFVLARHQVENVVRIMHETGAHVVLTSVWRKQRDPRMHVFYTLNQLGAEQRIPHWTESLQCGRERPKEIKKWLAKHIIQRFVVIDDEDYTEEFGEAMILCRCGSSCHFPSIDRSTPEARKKAHTSLGLTRELADKAIEFLNREGKIDLWNGK